MTRKKAGKKNEERLFCWPWKHKWNRWFEFNRKTVLWENGFFRTETKEEVIYKRLCKVCPREQTKNVIF